MTNTKLTISWYISSTEARSTESSLNKSTCFHKFANCAPLNQFIVNGLAGRIDAKGKMIRTYSSTIHDSCYIHNVFIATTGTTCYNSLIHIESTVFDAIRKGKVKLRVI